MDIIVKGYYGRDNLGDEIMMDIFIKKLKENILDSNIYIMNSSPQKLKLDYGIETPKELVSGKKLGIVMELKRLITILKSDIFILGGGTILTDKHSWLHLLENSIFFVSRKILGKRTYIVSVGSTKFRTSIGQFLCNTMIKSSTKCLVRDEKSYNSIVENYKGKDKDKIELTADLVLLSKDIYSKELGKNKEVDCINNIGFCIMPYYGATFGQDEKDDELAKKIANIIDKISLKFDVNISLIPIQSGKGSNIDKEFSIKVKELCESKVDIKEGNNIEEKISNLRDVDLIVSMRLHALMLGMLMKKKIISIDHNEKIESFMKDYSLESFNVKFDEMNMVLDNIEKILEEPSIQTVDENNINRLIKRANENINKILNK